MAYGKKQFRKAGEALRNFDDAYSAKIIDMYLGKDPKAHINLAQGLGAVYLGGTPLSMRGDKNAALGAAYTSAAAKYAAPAAGIGLAAQGVAGIYGGIADQQEPNQLSM